MSKELIIVANGWVDIYTYFEGNEFVLERLTIGSVINKKNFLVEDIMQVNIKSLTFCKLYKLSLKKFLDVIT